MSKQSSGGGISLLGTLQIIFLVLKLLDLINWTWGVVLIPFWIWLTMRIIIRIIWILYLTNMDYKYGKRK